MRKDGKCISASFRNPPETTKIRFEEITDPITINLYNVTYVLLNEHNNTIDLKGKVNAPGYYTFVVHYYQPNFKGI